MRGQGLPISTIVLAAIAVLVLVILVAFTTGSLNKLFTSTQTISGSVTPDEVASFRIGCEQACFQAKQLADTQTKFTNSDYCSRNLVNSSQTIKCWQAGVGVDCIYNITLPDHTEVTCQGAGTGSCTC